MRSKNFTLRKAYEEMKEEYGFSTQEDFRRHLGVSNSAMWRVMDGDYSVTNVSTLVKIWGAIGYEVSVRVTKIN